MKAKRLVAWLPYIVMIGLLYPLGPRFFHIHHPIIFLTLVLPGVSVAFVLAIYFLLRENGSG